MRAHAQRRQVQVGIKQEQIEFDKLKAAVVNSILITYPDPTKPFTYYPDASQKYACGRLLCWKQDGVEVTVCAH